MELNKGDDEYSDTEEKAMISAKNIESITHVRRMIEVKGKQKPATISLLGYEKRFIGIKVTLFSPETASETGFFLIVKRSDWKRTEAEKALAKEDENSRQDYISINFKLPSFLKNAGG